MWSGGHGAEGTDQQTGSALLALSSAEPFGGSDGSAGREGSTKRKRDENVAGGPPAGAPATSLAPQQLFQPALALPLGGSPQLVGAQLGTGCLPGVPVAGVSPPGPLLTAGVPGGWQQWASDQAQAQLHAAYVAAASLHAAKLARMAANVREQQQAARLAAKVQEQQQAAAQRQQAEARAEVPLAQAGAKDASAALQPGEGEADEQLDWLECGQCGKWRVVEAACLEAWRVSKRPAACNVCPCNACRKMSLLGLATLLVLGRPCTHLSTTHGYAAWHSHRRRTRMPAAPT